MRVSHSFPAISATFDDPNLVSCAGLAPTMALAQRAGLTDLVSSTLTLKAVGGVNAHLKVPALVAGMVAGADSIDDMDLLRHGGMGRLFTGVRAPSTLGTFLRSFTFGHVRQLDAVASRFVIALAKNAPILAGAGRVATSTLTTRSKPPTGTPSRARATAIMPTSRLCRHCRGCGWGIRESC